MWKCLKCGTENEWNFCIQCRSSKEENEVKKVTPKEGLWKCSRCGTEINGNFCVSCGMSRLENDSLQPKAEEAVAEQPEVGGVVPDEMRPDETVVVHQSPISGDVLPEPPIPQSTMPEQPIPQSTMPEPSIPQSTMPEPPIPQSTMPEPPIPQGIMPEQPIPQSTTPEPQAVNSDEGGGKKGCIIAIIVALVIVALIGGLIFAALNMIFGSRESEERVEVVIEEDIEEDEEYPEVEEIETINPFNFEIWPGGEVVQIEHGNITLDIPLPPDANMENVEIEESTFGWFQGEDEDWHGVWIILRNEMIDDFRVYSDYEVERALYWYNELANVTGHEVFFDGDATLVVIEWEDAVHDGITFTQISQYRGFILLVDLTFHITENREDYFEVYGFNKRFYDVIQDIIESRDADMDIADAGGNDRGEEAEWTSAQINSWWDLMDEFWEAADPSLDLFFYIWDAVILGDTILDDYPNADVERLLELHEEFDNRFEELLGFDVDIDLTLSYDHEDNRNAFRDMRDLIDEHERFYREFRAALEGR